MSSEDNKLVQISKIADQFGIDRSNFRKMLINWGYIMILQRVKACRNQQCLHICPPHAREVRARLKHLGYVPEKASKLTKGA